MNNELTNETEAQYTEPTQHPEPTPAPSPEPRQTIRRVGTLTMGFALIAAGIIALVSTFMPSFNLVNVFKLSPIIFVFLGIEILISYFFHKNERIKYDLFSGFVCFMLICGGMLLSFLPTLWNYVGPPAHQTRERLQTQAEDEIYTRLQANTNIISSYVNAEYPFYLSFEPGADPSVTAENSWIFASFELAGPYADELAFAQDCQKILASIKDAPYRFQRISFSSSDKQHYFHLEVHDKFQLNMDAVSLTQLVQMERIESDELDIDQEESADTYMEEDAPIEAESFASTEEVASAA